MELQTGSAERPLEVVVVDDEAQIADLLTMAIQFASRTARVHAFTDATAARDFLLRHPVDVVITDYRMPGYDGIELLKLAPPGATKVLISGFVTEVAEEKLTEMKAVFFEKPVSIKTVTRIISEAQTRLQQGAS